MTPPPTKIIVGYFSTLNFDPTATNLYAEMVSIALLKHLQKINFNTKGHFSTLNYDPSWGINFQRGQFFMRRGVVKKRGESLFNVENRPSIR